MFYKRLNERLIAQYLNSHKGSRARITARKLRSALGTARSWRYFMDRLEPAIVDRHFDKRKGWVYEIDLNIARKILNHEH